MNIFSYRDYRQLIGDAITRWRGERSNLSNREIGRRMGYQSPSWYREAIVDAAKNITEETARRFASFLHFSDRETDFLVLLVKHNQARTGEERAHFHAKLLPYWRETGTDDHILNAHEYKFMDKWFYSVIRELLPLCPEFGNRNSAERLALARKLRIILSDSQIDEAVRVLEELKFIRRDASGAYRKTGKGIRAEKTRAAQHLISRLIDHGKTIVDETDPKFRLIKTSLLCLSKATSGDIEKKINDFCREIADDAGADQTGIDRLYAMNIQFFPLTKLPEEE
jgi:uncharacterized protein (TIGR02147 family)